jgi:hypothetical protein
VYKILGWRNLLLPYCSAFHFCKCLGIFYVISRAEIA